MDQRCGDGEALRLLSTKTEQEAIDIALREVVARQKRLEAFDNLLARGMRGEFDQAAQAHAAAKKAWKEAWSREPTE